MLAKTTPRGGLRLDAHKDRSTRHSVQTLAAPNRLVIPLDQHVGLPAEPLVAVGEHVQWGQPIAKATDEVSAWLHSPVSGVIEAIQDCPAPHKGGAPTPSIVIANDFADTRHPSAAPLNGWQSVAAGSLRDHIARGGIVGLGGAAFPTGAKLSRAAREPRIADPELPNPEPRTSNPDKCWLLLNGAECEPYISCDEMLMRERAELIVTGAQILLHAIEAHRCVIAIEDDAPEAEVSLRAALTSANDSRIELRVIPSVYPAGGERQLIATI
ncbi:MAG TPA: hypothetical protein VFS47_14490, partial [Steroidobacteraceae bacterium]|nr:hypothetical protein [Steroidobacteraceae bacterium]